MAAEACLDCDSHPTVGEEPRPVFFLPYSHKRDLTMPLASWLASLVQRRRRPVRNAAPRKPARSTLRVEALEDRCVPATHTWTGAVDGNWSTAGNWQLSNAAPGIRPTPR